MQMTFVHEGRRKMIEVVMKVDDEFWDNITQLMVFKEQKEITHCKDCKYWEEDVPHNAYCEFMKLHGFEPDDFCSRGERK